MSAEIKRYRPDPYDCDVVEDADGWYYLVTDVDALRAADAVELAAKDVEIARLKSAIAISFCDLRQEVLTLTSQISALKAENEKARELLEEVSYNTECHCEKLAASNATCFHCEIEALLSPASAV